MCPFVRNCVVSVAVVRLECWVPTISGPVEFLVFSGGKRVHFIVVVKAHWVDGEAQRNAQLRAAIEPYAAQEDGAEVWGAVTDLATWQFARICRGGPATATAAAAVAAAPAEADASPSLVVPSFIVSKSKPLTFCSESVDSLMHTAPSVIRFLLQARRRHHPAALFSSLFPLFLMPTSTQASHGGALVRPVLTFD